MKQQQTVLWLLRIGLAFVFLYAAIASFIEPDSWIGYLPQNLRMMFPAQLLLTAFSVYEIVLGVWLLSSWKTFYAAIIVSLTLGGIIVTNFGAMDIVFRDVAILFMAVSLALATSEKPLFLRT